MISNFFFFFKKEEKFKCYIFWSLISSYIISLKEKNKLVILNEIWEKKKESKKQKKNNYL